MPKLYLDAKEDRYCELIGLHGYKTTDAVREVWPHLKLQSVYTKVKHLSKNSLVQARLKEYNDEALAEPRRIMKKAMRTADRILGDAGHKAFAPVFATVAKISGYDKEEKPVPPNIVLNIKYDE